MSDSQRAGQRAFNELYRTSPELANKIRGTLDDPFYNDDRLERFWRRVEELRAETDKK